MKYLIRSLFIFILGFLTTNISSKEKAVYELHSKDELFFLGEDSRAQDAKEKWNLDELKILRLLVTHCICVKNKILEWLVGM